MGHLTPLYDPLNIAKAQARQELNALIFANSPIADYRLDLGVTTTAGNIAVASIANQIGIAGPLLQATALNQPINLAFGGEKYLFLPGVAGNALLANNKVLTGNLTITIDLALDDYTPGSTQVILSKASGVAGIFVQQIATDKIRFVVGDGVANRSMDSTAATSLADGTRHTYKIVWLDGVGVTFFVDGVQLGLPVAGAFTLTNSATVLRHDSTSIGIKIYSTSITDGAGTTYYSMNASDAVETTTNGYTFVSGGDTYTLNNTGTKLAQIVGSSQILCDGVGHYLKAPAFPYTQAECIIFFGKQITHTAGDVIFDGNTALSGALRQFGASPGLDLIIGATNVAANAGAALNAKCMFTSIINGAASSLQINQAAAAGGNIGAGNMAGFTFGADANGANFANVQANELILLGAVPSAADLAQFYTLGKILYATT